ncbi:hypothetical protein BT96DRAFT_562966 [Gymnopus androsaceus JB14]|uniref:Kinesin light chain n=1 Tax=Gymnopus androsaceus JB14 TaxID=1447944 RepID=A0A6A4HVG6_9AGAR|nr:hypothetical protein BT96DRAFT_562966 [Gymnopus androsaceus JB14]
MGEEHPETLTRTNNLAMAYRNLGRYNEALELQKPLLEFSKQVMGQDHPGTLTCTNNSAITYHDQKEHETSIQPQKCIGSFPSSKQTVLHSCQATLPPTSGVAVQTREALKQKIHLQTTQRQRVPTPQATVPPTSGIAARAREAEKQKIHLRTTQRQRVPAPTSTSSRSQEQYGSNTAVHLDKGKRFNSK